MAKFIFYLKAFSKYLSRRAHIELCTALLLMLLGGFAELLSVALVVPFLSSLSSPDLFINDNKLLESIFSLLGIFSLHNKIIVLGSFFLIAICLSSLIRLYVIWFNAALSAKIGHEVSKQAYSNVLRRNFLKHKQTNTSDVISGIINHLHNTVLVINALLLASASILTILSIVIGLLALDPRATLLIIIVFISVYLLVAQVLNPRVSSYGRLIANSRNRKVKLLQESLGGIRELIMNDNYKFYSSIYSSIDENERFTIAKLSFSNRAPRIVIECLFITIIISISILLSVNSSNQYLLIPTLGLFTVAAQKLLPNIQNVFSTWVVLKSSKVQIEETLKLLDAGESQKYSGKFDNHAISFNDHLKFDDVSFRYPSSEKEILSNVNVKILKGDKVGIIGRSGSGKSTFIDLLTGLIEPTNGRIEIDEQVLSPRNLKSWHKQISYVSQDIFIYDESFAQNISMSRNVEIEKLHDASSKSLLVDFIRTELHGDVFKMLGERGNKLSGGQKQRIGLARAFYRSNDLLILDESTSALDVHTESEIVKNIRNSNHELTLFMISHNISTLEICDRILWFDNGKLINSGPPSLILKLYRASTKHVD